MLPLLERPGETAWRAFQICDQAGEHNRGFRRYLGDFLTDYALQGEPFADTKKRIQARLGMGEKEFSKIKFSLIIPSQYQKPSPIEDTDKMSEHTWAKDDYLGLDHPDRAGKARQERAL